MLVRHAKRFSSALLLLCLLAQPAFAVSSAPPTGPDVEDYHPPYSDLTQNATWRSAYLSGDQETAEHMARDMLAAALRGTRSDGFAALEARFMLGLTLDARGRKTEAEGEFRDGLAWLARQIGPGTRPGRKADRSRLALEWVRYFEIHLQDNLRAQGRLRESAGYKSLLPPSPRMASDDNSQTEVAGIGSLAGIATNLDLGTNRTSSTTAAVDGAGSSNCESGGPSRLLSGLGGSARF
jgi:hypothetical protein